MRKKKEKTGTDVAAAPSAVDSKVETPEKVAGPQRPPAETPLPTPEPKATPSLARTTDRLTAPDQNMDTAERGRMMESMQQGVGNARLNRMLNTGDEKPRVSSPEEPDEVEARNTAESVVATEDKKPTIAALEPPAKPTTGDTRGEPLSKADREFMEPRFGRSFQNVRLHSDAEAQEQASAIGAKAFTEGSDISFGPGSGPDDKKLLAHELTHVVQQETSTGPKPLQRDENDLSNLEKLNEMLGRWNVPENAVITLLGQLSAADKLTVLDPRRGYKWKIASALDLDEMIRAVNNLDPELAVKLDWVNAAMPFTSEIDYSQIRNMIISAPQVQKDVLATWRGFFVEVCSDESMAQAVDDLGWPLIRKLEWMWAEGSNWSLVKAKLEATADASQRLALYARADMLEFFVDICNDEEMADAVRILGGSLLQQLTWMKAEGSSWGLVKTKISETGDAAQKLALYARADMLEFFVDICNDEEMADAVRILGGSLLQQLTWMKAEGSSWGLVKTKISETGDAAQKLALYARADMLEFFVDICNDEEMADAVRLLGGSLLQQLTWMKAEGSSWSLVKSIILLTSDPAQKEALYHSVPMLNFFVDICNDEEMAEAVALLGGTLRQQLAWMKAEGSSWGLVRARIVATTDVAQKTALYGGAFMLDFFVDVCGDNQMAEAVDLLGFNLSQKLDWMIVEDTNYNLVKAKITSASAPEQSAVLADQPLLRRLRDELGWNKFAKSVELLGRTAPAAAALLADPTVQAQIASAWTASNPAVPGPGTTQHEEGGWIYMNLFTGGISVTRQDPGEGASIDLSDPPTVDDSVLVGYFHTHPNLGPGWVAGPSPPDLRNVGPRGVPAFIQSSVGNFTYGPGSRLHLAGDQGFPGAAGGEAPQARSAGHGYQV